MIGSKIAQFEIIEKLGEGGMGVVYKARDTDLQRFVAIKVLPPQKVADPIRKQRFIQEARAASALNHPNIITIHGIANEGGVDFIVMEYVAGKTLDRLIPSQGMPPGELLRNAVQIADALATAHEAGIVHRDLKPGNVMVSEKGLVKVLDFGLAKLIEPPEEAGDASATRTAMQGVGTVEGTIIGTICYMSPEQAEGKKIDARSDIFSFGSLLYEMATGRRAFTGDTPASVLSAVLRDHPQPANQATENLPGQLESIIQRCHRKEPSRRWQGMADLKVALEELKEESASSVRTATKEQPSIAVLPFTNLSADPENEYFSDGLAEEIINALVQNRGLKVIARTSAFAFKGQNKDVRQIAEVLGVDHVLEGSVRKAGNRIRVTAQLITARDGSHLWSQRYDRDLEDIFAVQDEVAQAIAETLQGKLATGSRPQRKYTPNLPAYEAVLKAWHDQWSFTPEGLERGRLYYEQALQLDPGFALAHSGYAHHFLQQSSTGNQPAREAMPQMREQAQAALELDASLAEAHGLLGIVAAIYDYDWQEAERRFRLALGCDSVPPLVRTWPGYFLFQLTGRARDGIAEQQRALKEDPLNYVFRFVMGSSLIMVGNYAEGDAQLRQAVDLAGGTFLNHFFLALSMAAQERLGESLKYAETAYSLAPWSAWTTGALAGISARMDDTARSEGLLRQLGDSGRHDAAFGFATAYIVHRDIEQAAKWAAQAIEARAQHIPWLLSHPISEPLRRSGQWPALARALNLPEVP
jgi:serine/threonine protein kinase/tetratricopeptide (TPR) repeat protein